MSREPPSGAGTTTVRYTNKDNAIEVTVPLLMALGAMPARLVDPPFQAVGRRSLEVGQGLLHTEHLVSSSTKALPIESRMWSPFCCFRINVSGWGLVTSYRSRLSVGGVTHANLSSSAPKSSFQKTCSPPPPWQWPASGTSQGFVSPTLSSLLRLRSEPGTYAGYWQLLRDAPCFVPQWLLVCQVSPCKRQVLSVPLVSFLYPRAELQRILVSENMEAQRGVPGVVTKTGPPVNPVNVRVSRVPLHMTTSHAHHFRLGALSNH